MADLPPSLTVAHQIPGRVRLRWHGLGPPPPEVLAEIEAQPGVRHVEYRADSRSIVARYEVDSPPRALPAAPRPARKVTPSGARVVGPAPRTRWLEADRERWVRVLEDLLTVGLVGAWILDLALGGGGAAIPALVVLMIGLAVYRVWQRRRPGRRSAVDDLMVLRSV